MDAIGQRLPSHFYYLQESLLISTHPVKARKKKLVDEIFEM